MQHRTAFAICYTLMSLSESNVLFLVSCLICDRLMILFFVLWQVIETHPPRLLELPLSLLSRLLLCDPEHSVSHLRKACGFFMPPRKGQPTSSKHHSPLTRTASSLLSDLLQQDVLWDCAVELLTLLSQVARFSTRPACLQLCLEASVLHQALRHAYDQIRISTCRLLANLDPFIPPTQQPDIFKSITNCLRDSSLPVRRMACRAVGNWLGYIAAGAGFKMGRSTGHSNFTSRATEKELVKNKCTHSEKADVAAVVEMRGRSEELGRWTEEARRTAAILTSLIVDPDAHTRRHCCAALGNLVNVDGAVSLLLEQDVTSLLLNAACSDSHNSVKQAAIATLCLYSQQDTIRQVISCTITG